MAAPSPTSDEQFAIGSVLDGRYRIDAVLGTGGMGRVYRAEHIEIGKSVAIKLLHADLHRNREASQRFHREAIASGKLDHPNIVGVSDSGVLHDGARYLVMEILEGESLGDRLSREPRLPWLEAVDILREVLYGLRHAHERGVVHRDIKPDNVYLARKDGDQVVKILDFGIAKLYAGSPDDPASTRAGLTVGTPAYLSPEQAVGGEITPASDLYSASIVLYEMLAGRAPFEDKDPLAMLGAHVSRQPPSFADIAPGVEVPAELEEVIQRGLAKSPAERIRTANDYLAMLDVVSPPRRPRLPTAPAMTVDQLGTAVTGPAPVVAVAPSLAAMTAATPLPGASGALAARVSPVTSAAFDRASLPRALRAVSLADVSEPIPLSWIVRSGVVIGLVIIAALALAITRSCTAASPETPARADRSAPGHAGPKPAEPAPPGSAEAAKPLPPSEPAKPAPAEVVKPASGDAARSSAPSTTRPAATGRPPGGRPAAAPSDTVRQSAPEPARPTRPEGAHAHEPGPAHRAGGRRP